MVNLPDAAPHAVAGEAKQAAVRKFLGSVCFPQAQVLVVSPMLEPVAVLVSLLGVSPLSYESGQTLEAAC